jgi:hypothetical protein
MGVTLNLSFYIMPKKNEETELKGDFPIMKIKPKTYSDKLKDPRWQKKRLEVLQRDGWTCQNCADKSSTLHVHHKTYRQSDPWDSPMWDLITLCESCHDEETHERQEIENQLLRTLRKAGLLTQHLGAVVDYFERQNEYFDLLADEKWSRREQEILKNGKHCFICYAENELVIYHKSSFWYLQDKPWELPEHDFNLICKSCNQRNRNNLCSVFDFLLPAIHHAGYHEDDIVDFVTDPDSGRLISSILKESKRQI